jgi:hypothetical protein
MSPDFDRKGYEVKPSESTMSRRFYNRELVDGESVLCFSSKNRELISQGAKMVFCTPSFIISEELKDIIDGNLYGGKLYPAMLNDYPARYFLLNMYKKLDCWDRDKSVYEQDDPDDTPHVIKYHLNSDILDNMDESKRLIFKMGGDDLSPMVVHETVKCKLEKRVMYLKFIPIDSYELGDEYSNV